MLEIDDRKAAVGEVHVDSFVGVGERTRLVRASVRQAPAHLLGGRATVDLLVGAGDAAHCQVSALTEARR